MENQESSQPRGSLDEKSLLKRPDDKDEQQTIDSNPPLDGETTTPDENPKDSVTGKEKEWEYVTGLKLMLVITAVTLACFLMLLDNSIISTVCGLF
jgi:hypothetical protein